MEAVDARRNTDEPDFRPDAPLALYRRYRPETFEEVIGQEHVTEPLRAALANNRVNHAYLFSGPRGCGKTTSARILARALNCEQAPVADPCGECQSCRNLARGAPGSILFPGGGWDRRMKADPDAIADMVKRELPFGRFGTPEEVADAVAFVASPRAAWIAGACIVVDGAQSRAF